MDCCGKTLVIPEKTDVERDAVADCWTDCGGRVVRLGRFWEPPGDLRTEGLRLYGNDTFCLVLAQKLGLSLVSPPDSLIADVPDSWLHREVFIMKLQTALEGSFPIFVKPVVPKQFRAAVYSCAEDLKKECAGLEPTTGVIISSVIKIAAEARAFILDGQVLDCSIYEGSAEPTAAADAARELVVDLVLPTTCVIDIGMLATGVWSFVEANASWGAGLNGCDARKVLPAIFAATRA